MTHLKCCFSFRFCPLVRIGYFELEKYVFPAEMYYNVWGNTWYASRFRCVIQSKCTNTC